MFLFRNNKRKVKGRNIGTIPAKKLFMAALALCVALWVAVEIIKSRLSSYFETPLNISTMVTYQLPVGASVGILARDLAELKVISSATWFKLSVRYLALDTKIKAGEYELEPGLTVGKLVDKLIKGDVIQHGVRIQAGWTIPQLFKALDESPFLEHQLSRMTTKDIVLSLGADANRFINSVDIKELEGQFYPDTYFVHKGSKDTEVLKRAFDKMQTELNALYQARNPNVAFNSMQEALILASIIEKESSVVCDQAAVASVLLNRLQKKMRLQADPTVVYGVDNLVGPIKPEHLSVDSPYNTYTRAGLPIGPIAIPSHNALMAALHPMESNLLYFVAKGDGTHYFSSTLEEHNNAINRYRTGNPSNAN